MTKNDSHSHLREHVVEWWRAHNGEAHQKDVGLWVWEGPKTIVIFLASCIPQTKADGLAVYHNICRVVIESKMALVSIISDNQVRGYDKLSFKDKQRGCGEKLRG